MPITDPAKRREYNRSYRTRHLERTKAWNRQWRAENPSVVRRNNLRRIGFTPEIFDEAVRLQGGKCGICRINLALLPPKNVHADHDHATKKPRGVLCNFCNAGLGHFADDLWRLKNALKYLTSPTLK